ncbi:uncharacterized protein Hap1MRO34_011754 isoform 2-T2 [Clarias gariepinus]
MFDLYLYNFPINSLSPSRLVSAHFYSTMMNPFIFSLIVSCLRERCLENNICHKQHGGTLTSKNCMVRQCRESVQPCILQTIQDVVREMQRKNPSASPGDLVLQAGEAVLMDFEPILNCLNEIDKSPFDAIVCVVEAFLGDTQEDKTDQKSPFMFNSQDFYKEAKQKYMESMHCLKKPNKDPIEAIMCVLEAFLGDNNQDFSSYMLCWIETSLNRIVRNCYSHYDKNTLNTLVKHLTNNQEHQTCFLKRFPYVGHKCILASMQIFGKSTSRKMTEDINECATVLIDISRECLGMTLDFYGSNPTIRALFKDITICSINEMITATASC